MKAYLRLLFKIFRSAVYLVVHLPHVTWIIFGAGRSSKQFRETLAAFAAGQRYARRASYTTGAVRACIEAEYPALREQYGETFYTGVVSELDRLAKKELP